MKVKNCADLYINKKFSGDYFFNRLCNIRCYDSESAIEESIKIFFEYGSNCYVYVHEYDRILEDKLLKMGFTLLDTMQVLKYGNKKSDHDNDKIHVSTIDINSMPIWIDVFCRSFNVIEWKSEVERIIKTYFNELTLLVSFIEDNYSMIPVGCAALFNRYDLMGLYCLGTVSPYRGQGLAKEIIRFSSDIARQHKFAFLFLQTFSNDGFIHFYRKTGFEVMYEKKIYMLNRQ
jgi:N-acetylglutamate synthase-like GNAT family acetyltransferase